MLRLFSIIYLFAMFTFLQPRAALALTEKVYFNVNRTEFIIFRNETDCYYIEKFQRSSLTSFQNLIWRKKITSKIEALKYLQKNIENLKLDTQSVVSSPDFDVIEKASSLTYLTEAPGKYLWKHTNNWNWGWELKYADWVKQNITADFLEKHNIPTDCADLAYVARWIFARIYSLPAANHLGGSHTILSNYSMRNDWLKLPTSDDWAQDKRFLKALDYLTNNTYTHTLADDSYPIEINPESLIVGTHHLVLHEDSGHTMLVYQVNEPYDVPLRLYYSDVPRVVRPLYSTIYNQYTTPEKNEGFLRFIWPEVTDGKVQFKLPKDMPHYSLEQYSPDFLKNESTFSIAVMKRLQPDFSWPNLVQSYIDEIQRRLQLRVQIVEQGFQFCQSHSCEQGTAGYDDWSTPSRDAQIVSFFQSLVHLTDEPTTSFLKTLITDQLNQKIIRLNGKDIKMNALLFRFLFQLTSVDPAVSLNERWGLDSDSLAKNVQASLVSLSQQRKKFKKDNICTKNCVAFTVPWLKASSLDIDQQIKRILHGVNLMRQFSLLDQDDLIKKFENIRVDGLALSEWIKKYPLINSDPLTNDLSSLADSSYGSFIFLQPDLIHVSLDQTLVRSQSNYADAIYALADQQLVAKTQDQEHFIADFNTSVNQYLWADIDSQSQTVRIQLYGKKLLSQWQISLPSAWIRAYWVNSSRWGNYLFIKDHQYYRGYSITGQLLFQIEHHLQEQSLLKIKKNIDYYLNQNQFCVFEMNDPTTASCLPYENFNPASVVDMNQNNVLTSLSVILVDGLPKFERGFYYNHITKKLVQLDADVSLRVYSQNYFSTTQNQTQLKTLMTINSQGQIQVIKQFPESMSLFDVGAGVFSVYDYKVTDGDVTAQSFWVNQVGQIQWISSSSDENEVSDAFSFQNKVYLKMKMKNESTRYRILNGPVIFECNNTTLKGRFVVSKNQVYLQTRRLLVDAAPGVLTAVQAFDQNTLTVKSGPVIYMDYQPQSINVESFHQDNQNEDIANDMVLNPTGFLFDLSIGGVSEIGLLGLRASQVLIYQQD